MPVDWSHYPHNWKQLRAQVMERAGDQCECVGECGQSHEHGRCSQLHGQQSLFSRARVVLTTAHLCDDDTCDAQKTTRKCGQLDHLKAMCQGCHLRLDAPLHARNARQTRTRKRDAGRGLLTIAEEQ